MLLLGQVLVPSGTDTKEAIQSPSWGFNYLIILSLIILEDVRYGKESQH